jgi:hypothetical protein
MHFQLARWHAAKHSEKQVRLKTLSARLFRRTFRDGINQTANQYEIFGGSKEMTSSPAHRVNGKDISPDRYRTESPLMKTCDVARYTAILQQKETELLVGLRGRCDLAPVSSPDSIEEVQLAEVRELEIDSASIGGLVYERKLKMRYCAFRMARTDYAGSVMQRSSQRGSTRFPGHHSALTARRMPREIRAQTADFFTTLSMMLRRCNPSSSSTCDVHQVLSP